MEKDTENNEQQEDFGSARKPITWQAHEYEHTEKGSDWYWALGLIAVAGSIGALLFNNILFAVFILLIAFVLAIFASRKPDIATFSISQRGVRINDTLYPFQTLNAFGIEELSPEHTPLLILDSKKPLVPHIVIPLIDVNVHDVHDFLHQYLKEEDLLEPLSHKIMAWLGF